MVQLLHVSERRIDLFEPRPSPPRSSRPGEPLVWAIDARTAVRQLLPRDCPRVYARGAPSSLPSDVERLLGSDRQVMWIPTTWVDRASSTQLFLHHLPAEGFTLEDVPAGYHVSARRVRPTSVEVIDDPLAALEARGVAVRPTKELRAVAERVRASSLDFSVVRLHLA